MGIEIKDVDPKDQVASKRAVIRVNNRWWTNPDVEGFKEVYLPNPFRQGKWRGFLGVGSNRAERLPVSYMWTLCRVVYERYVVLHNANGPFDLTELPEEVSGDADIEILWEQAV